MSNNLKNNHFDPLNPENDESDGSGSTGSLFDSGESGGSGGQGGQSGAVEFRYKDVLATPSRDDLLPATEIRRLHIVQKSTHKDLVKKQMFLRIERAALKDGTLRSGRERGLGMGSGSGGGQASRYKEHPISKKMAGMRDKQEQNLTDLQESQTNNDLKEQLQNQLQNRLQLQFAPKFHPKPRPV